MKTIIALLVTVCLVVTPLAAFAGKGGGGKGGGDKGPSQKAYENADDNARFKRKGDVEGSEGEVKAKERNRYEETQGNAKGEGQGNKARKRYEGTKSD